VQNACRPGPNGCGEVDCGMPAETETRWCCLSPAGCPISTDRMVLYRGAVVAVSSGGVILVGEGWIAMVPVRLVSMRLCLYRTSRVYRGCIGLCHSSLWLSHRRVRSIRCKRAAGLFRHPRCSLPSLRFLSMRVLDLFPLLAPIRVQPNLPPMCTRPLACLLA
jgi:hypothetical protein